MIKTIDRTLEWLGGKGEVLDRLWDSNDRGVVKLVKGAVVMVPFIVGGTAYILANDILLLCSWALLKPEQRRKMGVSDRGKARMGDSEQYVVAPNADGSSLPRFTRHGRLHGFDNGVYAPMGTAGARAIEATYPATEMVSADEVDEKEDW